MALWFPLMVNSNQIGAVEIIRRDEDAGQHGFSYDYTVTRLPSKASANISATEHVTIEQRTNIKSGTVTHHYEDGAYLLLASVLSDYLKVETCLTAQTP